MYKKYVKRWMDFLLSLLAITVLSPIIAVVAVLVRVENLEVGVPTAASGEGQEDQICINFVR